MSRWRKSDLARLELETHEYPRRGLMQTNARNMLRRLAPPLILDLYRKIRNQAIRKGTRRESPTTDENPELPKLPWRDAVGGMWDEIGRLQLEFMVSQGLLPYHPLLDVGCGSLRGGVHFARYLRDGHYYGIDAQQWLLDAGVQFELPRAGLGNRRVHLLCRDDFLVSEFGTIFDFAIAQSLFTHLTWNSILRCLCNISGVLGPAGRFFATFFEDLDGTHQTSPLSHGPTGTVSYPDRDPYHYPFSVLTELAQRSGLTAQYIGEWNHPRGQMMMALSLLRQA